jgi:hypothetical protein
VRAVLTSLRTRVVPAVLTGVGAALIVAGLLSYTNPVTATGPSPEPSASLDSPLPSFSPTIAPSASPTPGPSGTPAASGTPNPNHVVTRVAIPALGIDLAVVKPPSGPNAYPYCNVAMYLTQFHQPGQAGATYLFAHARTGMFLPLLDQSKVDNGAAMVGMLVQVYTGDDQLYLYEITTVLRHVPKTNGFDRPLAAKTEQLWLQTSEGPHGTPTVLQLVAKPLSSGPADHADAHPAAHPVVCG